MIKGLSKLKNTPGMTVSNARNDFINHLVPMSTEAEDCGLRVDICLSCSSRAAEAINTLLKTLHQRNRNQIAHKLLRQTNSSHHGQWSMTKSGKMSPKKAPGCNGQGQAAAAVGDGEDGSLLFSATSHLSTFLFPTQLFRA